MTGRLPDALFAQLAHFLPLTYEGFPWQDGPAWLVGTVLPNGEWVYGWLGPDGGVLSLLNELKNERQRADALALALTGTRQRLDHVVAMHTVYQPPTISYRCCMACTRLTGGFVAWPCETYTAATGAPVRAAAT
jgi:hypothetical protein